VVLILTTSYASNRYKLLAVKIMPPTNIRIKRLARPFVGLSLHRETKKTQNNPNSWKRSSKSNWCVKIRR